MESIRGFVYRLKPTPEQERQLAQTVGVVRLVYNLALEQRRIFGPRRYGGHWHNLGAKSLSGNLKLLREEYPWIAAVSQTAQNQALIDLDKAYANFFAGRAAYPTPRKRGVHDAFRQVGREIEVRRVNDRWSEVKVPKIGWVRYRDTRPLAPNADGEIEIRNATFRRSPDGSWSMSIALKCEVEGIATPNAAVGIDRGVAVPFALSTGDMIHLPDTLKRREPVIRRAQKVMSRRVKGSRRYAKARRRVARLKARNANARKHLAHVTSRRIVRGYGLVALEDLNTKGMTASARGTVDNPGTRVAQKSGLNRAILNVGWHQFETMLAYKLEETGGLLVKVPAAYTSQTCCACGHQSSENRESQAVFRCRSCGMVENADINAARVILHKAQSALAEENQRRANSPLLDVEGKPLPPSIPAANPMKRQLDAPPNGSMPCGGDGNPRPSGLGRC